MVYRTYNGEYRGGYQSLLVYHLATIIYDLTCTFCSKYISKSSRTFDQMVQAARSGKQNIVEGSLEKSIEGNLKLTGVSRASYGELLEDYFDYIRQHNSSPWLPHDSRVMIIRKTSDFPYSYKTYKSYRTYTTYMKNDLSYANLMITLCYKQGYLLDRLLRSIEQKFIKDGGFRENLFKKRMAYKTNRSYKPDKTYK